RRPVPARPPPTDELSPMTGQPVRSRRGPPVRPGRPEALGPKTKKLHALPSSTPKHWTPLGSVRDVLNAAAPKDVAHGSGSVVLPEWGFGLGWSVALTPGKWPVTP